MDKFTVSTLKEWGFENLVDCFNGTYMIVNFVYFNWF